MSEEKLIRAQLDGAETAQSQIDAGMWIPQHLMRDAGLVRKLEVQKVWHQKRIEEIDRMLAMCAEDPKFVERYDLLGKIKFLNIRE